MTPEEYRDTCACIVRGFDGRHGLTVMEDRTEGGPDDLALIVRGDSRPLFAVMIGYTRWAILVRRSADRGWVPSYGDLVGTSIGELRDLMWFAAIVADRASPREL